MPRPRVYASNAERQRAYRERHHVCDAESILPKRLLYALAAYADGDQERFDRMVSAVIGADDRIAAMLARYQGGVLAAIRPDAQQ